MDFTEFYLPDTVWLTVRPPIISYRSIFKVQLLSHFEFNWRGMIDNPTYSVMDLRYIASNTKLTVVNQRLTHFNSAQNFKKCVNLWCDHSGKDFYNLEKF